MPASSANAARLARPNARFAQPCGLRRMAVLLPCIDRLVFVLQVHDPDHQESLPLRQAGSGRDRAGARAKFGAVRSFGEDLLAARVH